MTPSLLIRDDFAQDFLVLRKLFLDNEFKEVKGLAGESYPGICVLPHEFWGNAFSQAVGRPTIPMATLLRLNYAGESSKIHADVGYGDIAFVFYLNELDQCQGGTAFWRHKATGLEWLSKDPAKATDELWEIGNDWKKPDAWEMVELAEMVPNRLIAYPTRRFHSRWPLDAFGKTKETARFVLVSFAHDPS